MNEPHVIHVVRQNLNRSARILPVGVVTRLVKARDNALAHQKRSVRGAMLAAVGFQLDLDDLPRQLGAFVAVLLLALACVSYWHGQEYIAGLEEVDSAILTDDLPLGAFVDTGFDAWLRSSAER